MNIFDHLKNITVSKGPFLGEEGWNNWMVNRYLSMDQNYIEAVNIIQKHTWQLTPERLYRVYKDIIPKRQVYLKYLKSSKKKEFKPEDVEVIADYFEISKKEAIEYMSLLDKENLKAILEQFKVK